MAIGDIYLLDKNLELVYVIDTYRSCIWANRYVEIGDCELYIPATYDLFTALKIGYYLIRQNDNMVCRIRKIELDTDAENGDYIIITGKDTKDLCDQRIVWSTMNCNGNLETFIRRIVNNTMINNVTPARNMKKADGTPLVALGASAGFKDVLTQQVTYDNVGVKIREYCTRCGWGYRMDLDGTTLKFYLYKGADRSNFVFFSDDYENLDTTQYMIDNTNMGNVALVGGEGEGSKRTKATSGYAESTERHEIFVDAKDISKSVTWIDLVTLYPLVADGGEGYFGTEDSKPVYKLHNLDVHIVDSNQLTRLKESYPNGTEITIDGMPYYQIHNVTVANLEKSNPSDDDTCTLRGVIYNVYLLNRGYTKLAEYGEKVVFNGKIEPIVTFMYREDYNLGDIVTVYNRYGLSAAVRIVEIVEVDDDNGYSVQPKFEIVRQEE